MTSKNFINWESIWEIHSPNFSNGLAHIAFAGSEILLKPGAGFGDASHPTTILMLKLMLPYIKNKVVLDVGSGTGILSIASVIGGAKKVFALEIDPGSISHTKENVYLNKLSHKICINEPIDIVDTILMNMISSEQKKVFEEISILQDKTKTLIVSGLLKEEINTYQNKLDRKAKTIETKGTWAGLVFLAEKNH